MDWATNEVELCLDFVPRMGNSDSHGMLQPHKNAREPKASAIIIIIIILAGQLLISNIHNNSNVSTRCTDEIIRSFYTVRSHIGRLKSIRGPIGMREAGSLGWEPRQRGLSIRTWRRENDQFEQF